MAYANIRNQACAGKIELFCRVRDFICKRNGTYDYSSTGIGWTLHDSSYDTDEDNPIINDWFVIKSEGEGSKDNLYFKFTWTSNYLNIHGYQMWDNFEHSGVHQFSTTNNWGISESGALALSVYGDLDEVIVLNRLSDTDQRANSFGKGEPAWADQSEEMTICSGVLLAGSDVSIALDPVPSYWVPGREIYVRTTHDDNVSNVHIEKTTIKTISSGVITVDLANTYIAGSAISDFVGYFQTAQAQWVSTTAVLIGEQGTIPTTAGWVYNSALPEASFDPGVYEDRWTLLDYYLSIAAAGLLLKSRHIRRIPTINVGITVDDILEEWDGTQWRVTQMYSVTPVGIREE